MLVVKCLQMQTLCNAPSGGWCCHQFRRFMLRDAMPVAPQVRRPIERGYLVNVDAQRDIWAHSLADTLRCGAGDSALLLTEPVLNLPSIQEAVDQVHLPAWQISSGGPRGSDSPLNAPRA